MSGNEAHIALANEIIAKQADILGPEIATLKARNVKGLEMDDKGVVTAISGDPEGTINALVGVYIELSGNIVKNILSPIFLKYPNISAKI